MSAQPRVDAPSGAFGFEARRVAVQQTMDRATLAAASLENELDPEQVVTSYFEAAGLVIPR